MTHLSTISGIGRTSLELLEAVGFNDAESLAKAAARELFAELERANQVLQIAKQAPSESTVEKWIASARELTGQEQIPEKTEMPINYELSPRVVSILATAPFAIPLPARYLIEKKLAVSDICAGVFLNRYHGTLNVKSDGRAAKSLQVRTKGPSSFVQIADNAPGRLQIDNSRLKTTDTMVTGEVRPFEERHSLDDERVALIRGPREETNRGRDPKSQFYIRGVLHSHPFSLVIGAIVTLILAVALPVSIVSAALLLLSEQVPSYFSLVPKWLLVFPLGLPVLGILYLIFGLGGSCRICGQRQFVPRACLKNPKAHRVRGLGYIIPVSLHMLVFKWFRCTYCGTPVRLKK